uniref:AB hydrolase-1 domain-containing protein n=1 Tax=Chaetoceros debilis TaxID=122233 RepID=A0A7S3Q5A3_9STRA
MILNKACLFNAIVFSLASASRELFVHSSARSTIGRALPLKHGRTPRQKSTKLSDSAVNDAYHNQKRQSHVELKYVEFSRRKNSGGGVSKGDPVVLLHGLLGQKRNFASLGSNLASQLKIMRRIYAVDLRNHGENTHDWREEMSYSDMAEDVLAFLDKHGMERAILIGHSMGGKVAKSLALSHPDRITGLVVLDISPVTYTAQDPSWKAVQGIIKSLTEVQLIPGKTKSDIDKDLRESVEDPALRQFVLTNLEVDDNEILRWKINIDAISNQLHKIASFDVNWSSSLEENDTRLLQEDGQKPENEYRYEGDLFLIKGGASSFVKGSHMPLISKRFPNYMLTTIRGAGHWIHAESPDATLALLKKYLDRY